MNHIAEDITVLQRVEETSCVNLTPVSWTREKEIERERERERSGRGERW